MHTHSVYFIPEAPAAPADHEPVSRNLTRFVVAAMLFPFIAAGTLKLSEGTSAAPARPAAAHTPAASLPALGAIDRQAVATLRSEGFQAGLAEGLAQGCGATALAMPIGTAR